MYKDIMSYWPTMEQINSPIRSDIFAALDKYDEIEFQANHVEGALAKDSVTLDIFDFGALLSPAAVPFLEQMAERALVERRRYFGDAVYFFSPLYIANYCENQCLYCGFNCHENIRRARLDRTEIAREMEAMAASGLEEVLILTGESPRMSSPEYIAEACRIARQYFKNVGIEVYPMNTSEYKLLRDNGADFVTVFQETYDPVVYERYHRGGAKRIMPYRIEAQERALMAGMRGVAFGALLGLGDARRDAFGVGVHAHLLQKRYPAAEISLSCPRLRPVAGQDQIKVNPVSEEDLLQIILAYRIFLPYAGITVSTRERAGFRDQAMKLCATKISAEVSTGIGSHADGNAHQGDAQFDIADERTVVEIAEDLKNIGMQPVMNDYIYL
ncbi:MAG TPA: 2-iminoacetate synthase ThiH [Clostridiaceae bacterium]|nr:2-iminoacetate synthase ThiH [Clostridiaceae bacterium]